MQMRRYLLMPFRAAPLILVTVFTVIWAYAIKAKFLGIPADAILVSWFFKYCYVLLDMQIPADPTAQARSGSSSPNGAADFSAQDFQWTTPTPLHII